jgi:hydroxymethylpyrimidine/phosphomethylpyrimidine kinase
VLVIAGNDPSGGAGLAADIQTLARLGCHPAPVVTALVVEDSVNAYDVQFVEPRLVREQAHVVLDDLSVDIVKLGLLGRAEIGTVVAELLTAYPHIPVVLDPVLAAAGGAPFAENALLDIYHHELLPLTTVATPNAQEIRQLAPAAKDSDARAAALTTRGARFVLAKGGDEKTADVENALYDKDGLVERWTWPRLAGSYHGSGCTLASAIAAGLSHDKNVQEAVAAAQNYTWQALEAGWQPGRGQYFPNRQATS